MKQTSGEFYKIRLRLLEQGILPQYETIEEYKKRCGKILMCPNSWEKEKIAKFRRKNKLLDPDELNQNIYRKATGKDRLLISEKKVIDEL